MNALEKEQRFNEIYEQYKSLVWWYVYNKFIGSHADKEDICQRIWMGVWKSIEKIEPGKEHAWLYKTITNQINKAIYYSMRDKQSMTIEEENSSEGDAFDLLEITDLIDQMDEYSYFELLDTIENTLTEEEFELFIHYIQGIPISQLRKIYHVGFSTLVNKYEVIRQKLSVALEQEAKFDFLFKRVSGKKGKSYPFSEEHKQHLKEARKGYKHSEETKKKISEGLKKAHLEKVNKL